MSAIKNQDTLAHFDERAADWGQLYKRPQFQDRLQLFLNGITNNVTPQSTILDYGCGTGRIAMELATCGYHVKGIDGASEMINEARCEAKNKKISNISFEVINPSTWHSSQQYNAIICSSVLQYIPDDKSLLEQFAEALTPGGILLISVPYLFSITGTIEDTFRSCRYLITSNKHDIHFSKHRYTRTAFKLMLDQTGFEPPSWTSFEFPFFNQIGIRLSRIPMLGVLMLANTRRINTP
jgi:2-polyprenyl-3-methyl-5-hydroxy-6-metoxy-1,4-benzoquinol methylase